ncbi:MAG: 1-acyl-sn-glycerol-3-phosphate acyltransferase, partial [Thermomicrobiales bacterium]
MDDDGPPVGLIGSPSPRASRSYRAVLAGAHLIGQGVFGFRVEVHGRAHLPRGADGRVTGGWIAAGLPHRSWVDPFIVADSLPVEPRLILFGDGRAMFRSVWRRWLVRRVGGLIPLWPGGDRTAIETYLAAAAAAMDAGAVLCLFPETGPPTTPGIARPFGAGLGYFALRTGAPIVPIILGGTDELYRGRRFRLDIQEPVTWQELVGVGPGAQAPDPWSSTERRTAHQVRRKLHDRTAAAVAAAHLAATPPPGTRKRWRWLTD